MSAGADLVRKPFTLEVPAGGNYQVALTGLNAGFWHMKGADGKVNFNVNVVPGENTVYFNAAAGQYTVSPGRAYDAGTQQP
jgi:hypothetical protein